MRAPVPRYAGKKLNRQRVSRVAQDAGPLDRKSTRLNSSHSQISYAVFCLKKKAFAMSRASRGFVEVTVISRMLVLGTRATLTFEPIASSAAQYPFDSRTTSPEALPARRLIPHCATSGAPRGTSDVRRPSPRALRDGPGDVEERRLGEIDRLGRDETLALAVRDDLDVLFFLMVAAPPDISPFPPRVALPV